MLPRLRATRPAGCRSALTSPSLCTLSRISTSTYPASGRLIHRPLPTPSVSPFSIVARHDLIPRRYSTLGGSTEGKPATANVEVTASKDLQVEEPSLEPSLEPSTEQHCKPSEELPSERSKEPVSTLLDKPPSESPESSEQVPIEPTTTESTDPIHGPSEVTDLVGSSELTTDSDNPSSEIDLSPKAVETSPESETLPESGIPGSAVDRIIPVEETINTDPYPSGALSEPTDVSSEQESTPFHESPSLDKSQSFDASASEPHELSLDSQDPAASEQSPAEQAEQVEPTEQVETVEQAEQTEPVELVEKAEQVEQTEPVELAEQSPQLEQPKVDEKAFESVAEPLREPPVSEPSIGQPLSEQSLSQSLMEQPMTEPQAQERVDPHASSLDSSVVDAAVVKKEMNAEDEMNTDSEVPNTDHDLPSVGQTDVPLGAPMDAPREPAESDAQPSVQPDVPTEAQSEGQSVITELQPVVQSDEQSEAQSEAQSEVESEVELVLRDEQSDVQSEKAPEQVPENDRLPEPVLTVSEAESDTTETVELEESMEAESVETESVEALENVETVQDASPVAPMDSSEEVRADVQADLPTEVPSEISSEAQQDLPNQDQRDVPPAVLETPSEVQDVQNQIPGAQRDVDEQTSDGQASAGKALPDEQTTPPTPAHPSPADAHRTPTAATTLTREQAMWTRDTQVYVPPKVRPASRVSAKPAVQSSALAASKLGGMSPFSANRYGGLGQGHGVGLGSHGSSGFGSSGRGPVGAPTPDGTPGESGTRMSDRSVNASAVDASLEQNNVATSTSASQSPIHQSDAKTNTLWSPTALDMDDMNMFTSLKLPPRADPTVGPAGGHVSSTDTSSSAVNRHASASPTPRPREPPVRSGNIIYRPPKPQKPTPQTELTGDTQTETAQSSSPKPTSPSPSKSSTSATSSSMKPVFYGKSSAIWTGAALRSRRKDPSTSTEPSESSTQPSESSSEPSTDSSRPSTEPAVDSSVSSTSSLPSGSSSPSVSSGPSSSSQPLSGTLPVSSTVSAPPTLKSSTSSTLSSPTLSASPSSDRIVWRPPKKALPSNLKKVSISSAISGQPATSSPSLGGLFGRPGVSGSGLGGPTGGIYGSGLYGSDVSGVSNAHSGLVNSGLVNESGHSSGLSGSLSGSQPASPSGEQAPKPSLFDELEYGLNLGIPKLPPKPSSSSTAPRSSSSMSTSSTSTSSTSRSRSSQSPDVYIPPKSQAPKSSTPSPGQEVNTPKTSEASSSPKQPVDRSADIGRTWTPSRAHKPLISPSPTSPSTQSAPTKPVLSPSVFPSSSSSSSLSSSLSSPLASNLSSLYPPPSSHSAPSQSPLPQSAPTPKMNVFDVDISEYLDMMPEVSPVSMASFSQSRLGPVITPSSFQQPPEKATSTAPTEKSLAAPKSITAAVASPATAPATKPPVAATKPPVAATKPKIQRAHVWKPSLKSPISPGAAPPSSPGSTDSCTVSESVTSAAPTPAEPSHKDMDFWSKLEVELLNSPIPQLSKQPPSKPVEPVQAKAKTASSSLHSWDDFEAHLNEPTPKKKAAKTTKKQHSAWDEVDEHDLPVNVDAYVPQFNTMARPRRKATVEVITESENPNQRRFRERKEQEEAAQGARGSTTQQRDPEAESQEMMDEYSRRMARERELDNRKKEARMKKRKGDVVSSYDHRPRDYDDDEWDEEEDDGHRRPSKEEKRARKEARRAQREADKKAARENKKPEILMPQYINVADLAEALRLKTNEFLDVLEQYGFENMTQDTIMTGETAALVAQEFGYEVTVESGDGEDLKPEAAAAAPQDASEWPSRPPVVTIMGHVDHGKTTLLDYMRKSSIVKQEHGGITQHIGAFVVKMPAGQQITFLDTPGHAAFLSMRQRGAIVTDMVVLVVAADDSVKPQTLEALKHVRQANVPMIVAISKVDAPGARIDQVKSDLSQQGVEIEDFGGDVPVVCVSGLTGQGMGDLEETILTLSEVLDFRAPKDGMAEGWVVEANVKSLGKAATVLVKRGTLRVGDVIVAGPTFARIRALLNEAGESVAEAGPGMPVEVLGWKDLPSAGDQVLQAPDEGRARTAVQYRVEMAEREKALQDVQEAEKKAREEAAAAAAAKEAEASREEGDEGGKGEAGAEADAEVVKGPKKAYFVVRGDVTGSVEAVCATIESVGSDEAAARVLRSGVGQLTESDVDYAATVGARLVNFNTPVPGHVKRLADAKNVDILEHNIIYRLHEDVRARVSELLADAVRVRVLAEADVVQVFAINVRGRKYTNVAGCRVRNGVVRRGDRVRILRKREVIYEGSLTELKQNKKEVTEMHKNSDCGMSFAEFQDLQAGDQVQTIEEIHEKRTL